MKVKASSMVKFGMWAFALDAIGILSGFWTHNRFNTILFLGAAAVGIVAILIWGKIANMETK